MTRTRWRSDSPPPSREVGADALNLRVQLPGMSPEQVREQIERIGATVVASLRKIWPAAGRLSHQQPRAATRS